MSLRSVTVALVAVGALVTAGCASSKSSTGVTVATTTATTAPAATTPPAKTAAPGATTAPAASGANIAVTAGDTKGLNGPMTLVAATKTAPTGDVTFVVKNTGTIEHEMVVLKTDTAFDKIPVVDSGDPPAPVATGADKIDEAAKVAETGDPNLKAGDTRTFTAKGLTAGKYVLVCNIAKHYGLGMRTAFTVT